MPKVYYSQTKLNMFPYSDYSKQTVNGVTTVLYDTKGMMNFGQSTKTGYRDTDWKVKVRKRSDASSAYSNNLFCKVIPTRLSFTGTTRYYDAFTKKWSIGTADYRRFYLHHYAQLGLTVTDAATRDIALSRIKRKLAGKLGQAELLIPTAELREVRGSITHAAEFTGKFMKTMGDLVLRKKPSSLVKFMQENWLAYSFGIAPMVSDIQSGLKAVNNYFDRPTSLHRIQGLARKQWVDNKVGDTDMSIGWMLRTSSQVKNTLTYKFVAGIDFKVITGNNYGIGEHLGFSDFWSNLPSLGWELLPFSWVIDYFSTVGSYLSDTFVLPPGSSKYMTETRIYEGIIDEKQAILKTKYASSWTDHHQDFYTCKDGHACLISMSRVVLSQLPHRDLRIKTLDEVGKNAVNRLLNLTSLVNFQASKKLQRHERRSYTNTKKFAEGYEHL